MSASAVSSQRPLPNLADADYWNFIERWAAACKSDGCTMSLDVYPRACYEHDYHWRYGVTVYGDKIPPSAANARFRAVIQMHSRFRAGSPMSYVRFTAVTLNGWRRSLFRRWKYVECPPEWRLVDPVVEI